MMIAFTLCSNNYLAFASVLCSTLKAYNPNCRFVLGLVDQLHAEIEYQDYAFDSVIPIADVVIPDFLGMVQKYNIIELNTAVKPFVFSHLFETYPDADHISYFDPDIAVYGSLDPLFAHFKDSEVLLIPHFQVPQDRQAGLVTPERKILQRGLYNLGYLGLRRGEQTIRLLDWWQRRLQDQCYIDMARGLFVDQKWMDLVPVFFDNVKIIKQAGYDVAYWNLYQYQLTMAEGGYVVNGQPLRFYHFSAFKLSSETYIDALIAPFSAEMGKALRHLYEAYRDNLFSHGHQTLRTIPYAYARKESRIKRGKKFAKRWLAKRVV